MREPSWERFREILRKVDLRIRVVPDSHISIQELPSDRDMQA